MYGLDPISVLYLVKIKKLTHILKVLTFKYIDNLE